MNHVELLFGASVTVLFVWLIFELIRVIDMLQRKDLDRVRGVFQESSEAVRMFIATYLVAAAGVLTGPLTTADIELAASVLGATGILYFIRTIRKNLSDR